MCITWNRLKITVQIQVTLIVVFFFPEIPPGTPAHCVAGEVNASGKLKITYRFCNESLPVLCEVKQSEETNNSIHMTSVVSTTTTVGNIIDNTGTLLKHKIVTVCITTFPFAVLFHL